MFRTPPPGAMALVAIAASFAISPRLLAQAPPPLSSVPIPRVDGLDDYVADRSAAVLLGKALFWDQQVGSDGMACASCHFHAGADSRFKNQVSPSLLHRDPSRAGVFDRMRTGSGGPNYELRRGDFPFHVLRDPDDRDSTVVFDTDDVASSAGVFRGAFRGVGSPASLYDSFDPIADPLFRLGTRNTRRVEPRNTPTAINAVFNFRNFWDGRANNVFNGQNPFGRRDPDARVMEWRFGQLRPVQVALTNSSLASQAVGPPLSEFEMSFVGRTFPDLGRKLVDRTPLAFQEIAASDSVLGSECNADGYGLRSSYRALIQRAFRSRWWAAPASVQVDGYTQIERNFALFWGLAIQLYESTLVSDDAPYDRYAAGDRGAMSAAQIRGLDLFLGKGRCINCHGGPDFTNAGSQLFGAIACDDEDDDGPYSGAAHQTLISRMTMGDGRVAVYDEGFYNIGVRPTVEDIGLGGTDPFGNPLSFTRQWLAWIRNDVPRVDRFGVDPRRFEESVSLPRKPSRADLNAAFGGDPDAVDGAFKTPGLRNVELTGPYFHNGGQATLEQVIEFYDRGGDRRRVAGGGNTSGFAANPSNLDPDISPIGFTAQEASDVVAFLMALTDERVRWERAPFDHPQLALPHGHGSSANTQLSRTFAVDRGTVLPAVGRYGRAARGFGPLPSFASQLR